MKYKKLGVRGPMVSVVGFGAWAIGGTNWGKTDDNISKNAIRAAIENGARLIDTADVYGNGHSEELISDVLADFKGDKIVIATKAGTDFYNATKEDDVGYGAIRPNYSKDYIIFAAEQSLKRLKTDCIDILQLHSGDFSHIERDDPWEALALLKKQGKIKHAGWSVKSFKEIEHAPILDKYKDILDCIQIRYNLLERDAEKIFFPKAIEYGIGVIVRIPMLYGFLTGKFNENSIFTGDDHRKFSLSPEKIKKYLKLLDKVKPLFNEYPEQTMGQVSLRFCLSHPAVHTVIPGAKTPEQAIQNTAVGDMELIPQDKIPNIE